jgi:hypothetical protein
VTNAVADFATATGVIAIAAVFVTAGSTAAIVTPVRHAMNSMLQRLPM